MDEVRRPIRVAVAGASEASPREVELAEALGAALARRGAVVICGGLGGVMEAVCLGARREGGRTVGFLPGTSPESANRWVELPVATGMGEGRNVLVARSGEALIAVGGGWGTLSEIALARKLLLPVAVLGPWEHPGLGLEQFEDPEVTADWAVRVAGQARSAGRDPGPIGVV